MRRRIGLLAMAAMALAATAGAQTPASGGDAPSVTWRASAGHESYAFQDLARSKPPVDGSPIVWRGGGPVVSVDYSRRRPFRLHRFEWTATSNGGFVYDTAVGVTPRPSNDAASFVFVEYDY